MSFFDHIARCNTHDLAAYRRFIVQDQAVGYIRPQTAEALRALPDLFDVSAQTVHLSPTLKTMAERTQAMDAAATVLIDKGLCGPLRHEAYPLVAAWGLPPLATLDRGLASAFGVLSFGVHLNGYVYDAHGNMSLWIARRALTRPEEAGKLDNMVAGGQPFGLSLADNVKKESYEEAGLSPELAAKARAVSTISYKMESPRGLRNTIIFCFDLEMPADVTPTNTDGEVESFSLLPMGEVATRASETFDFKFNVPLVMADFLIRHGHMAPDSPDFPKLVQGLRQ